MHFQIKPLDTKESCEEKILANAIVPGLCSWERSGFDLILEKNKFIRLNYLYFLWIDIDSIFSKGGYLMKYLIIVHIDSF